MRMRRCPKPFCCCSGGIFLFFPLLLLCQSANPEKSEGFLAHIAHLQSVGETPENPSDLVRRHKQDFVTALEFGADQSLLMPVYEYHVDVLRALQFLLEHIAKEERTLDSELQTILARVAVYPGPFYRVKLALDILSELTVLDDETISFLIDEGKGDRQHSLLWRVIAKHADSSQDLFRFYKSIYCKGVPERAFAYARMALKDVAFPDAELLQCVLENVHHSTTVKAAYIMAHTEAKDPLRALLATRLRQMVLDQDLDETSRTLALLCLYRHFDRKYALESTTKVLEYPRNPDRLVVIAVRYLKNSGVETIADSQRLLEPIPKPVLVA